MNYLLVAGAALLLALFVFLYLLMQKDEQGFRATEKVMKQKLGDEINHGNDKKKTKVSLDLLDHGLADLTFSHKTLQQLKDVFHEHIVGMDEMINSLIVALLSDGHVLVEGVPGLAKTKTIHTFADLLGVDFSRVQFTPDMLPSDLVGVEIFNNKKKDFEVKLGPIVSNIVLADEINRTTPKVQAALLESMQEKQITLGGKSHKLPAPFLVLATQNPIEHEGTYPLPEAQIDRFLCKVLVSYPDVSEEKAILSMLEKEKKLTKKNKLFTSKKILALRKSVEQIMIEDPVKGYIARIVHATRSPSYQKYVRYGSSPRGSLALMNTAKAVAFLQGKKRVTHEDVQMMVLPALRHRIILSYDAKVEGVLADDLLKEIIQYVPLVG